MHNSNSIGAGALVLLLALVVAGAGAIVGLFTDFTGKTVYQVPQRYMIPRLGGS